MSDKNNERVVLSLSLEEAQLLEIAITQQIGAEMAPCNSFFRGLQEHSIKTLASIKSRLLFERDRKPTG